MTNIYTEFADYLREFYKQPPVEDHSEENLLIMFAQHKGVAHHEISIEAGASKQTLLVLQDFIENKMPSASCLYVLDQTRTNFETGDGLWRRRHVIGTFGILKSSIFDENDFLPHTVLAFRYSFYILGDKTPLFEEVSQFFQEIKKSTESEIKEKHSLFSVIISTPMGPTFIQKRVPQIPFQAENYSTDVVSKHEQLSAYLQNHESLGRLTILQGNPGTGKTWFIRHLLNLPGKSFYFPIEMAEQLSSPTVLSLFEQQKYSAGEPIQESKSSSRAGRARHMPTPTTNEKTLVVIEDGDVLLAKRDGGRSPVSQFLNMCDGLLGEAFNLHLIVSTNLPRTEMDPAILRAGRLYSLIQFEELSRAQAEILCKRELGETLPLDKTTYTLAEIYQQIAGHKNNVVYKPALAGQYI